MYPLTVADVVALLSRVEPSLQYHRLHCAADEYKALVDLAVDVNVAIVKLTAGAVAIEPPEAA